MRTQLSIALQGIVTQQLLPPPTASAAPSPPRCWSDPAIRNLIREGKTHQIYAAVQTSGRSGCRPWTPTWRALRDGKITRSVAEQRASVPEELNGCSAAPMAAPAGRGERGDGGPAAAHRIRASPAYAQGG